MCVYRCVAADMHYSSWPGLVPNVNCTQRSGIFWNGFSLNYASGTDAFFTWRWHWTYISWINVSCMKVSNFCFYAMASSSLCLASPFSANASATILDFLLPSPDVHRRSSRTLEVTGRRMEGMLIIDRNFRLGAVSFHNYKWKKEKQGSASGNWGGRGGKEYGKREIRGRKREIRGRI